MHWLVFYLLASLRGGIPLPSIEERVIAEVNRLRLDPPAYAEILTARRNCYRGRVLALPGARPVRTGEGTRALDETIAELRATAPAGALEVSAGLSMAAADHVNDQGPRGDVGHSRGAALVGENIVYGSWDAEGVVFRFLVDDGVAGRGHRRNLLRPEYRFIGAACGPHAVWDAMCVLTFARGYAEDAQLLRARLE